MSVTDESPPAIRARARVVETAAGAVEYDLTPGDGAIVLASHGGWGGLDQARVLLDWLDPAGYRLLSVSRPGYLGTPLCAGTGPRSRPGSRRRPGGDGTSWSPMPATRSRVSAPTWWAPRRSTW